jgi:hypothetical protein
MELENNDIFQNLKQPIQFKERIVTLQSQLPSILKDYQKYYVFYYKNPESQEYHQMFENIQKNLNTINSELFVISNEVDSNTNLMNNQLFDLDVAIQQEKKSNFKLKSSLGIVENKYNASNELITNYKEIYNSKYLRNWGLFLSILIIGIIVINIY